ncbi:MAG: Mini-ribonuclease 3 [Firmicutes bacterium]|nr:Mini-ribonuclease 3 [Bacillota bacterium]
MQLRIQRGKLSKIDIRQLSPLILAFIGDAAYELYIRNHILTVNSEMSPHKMHLEAIKYVKAHAQSEFVKRLMDELSEEEVYYFKKGRNAKSGTVPKNADVQEYRHATGFECLIGYLYLTEQDERLEYIFEKIVDYKEEI